MYCYYCYYCCNVHRESSFAKKHPSIRESSEVFFALLEIVGKGGKSIATKMTTTPKTVNVSAFRLSSSFMPVLCPLFGWIYGQLNISDLWSKARSLLIQTSIHWTIPGSVQTFTPPLHSSGQILHFEAENIFLQQTSHQEQDIPTKDLFLL